MSHVGLGMHNINGRDNVTRNDPDDGQRETFRVVVFHNTVERVPVQRGDDHIMLLEVETLDENRRKLVVVCLVHSF